MKYVMALLFCLSSVAIIINAGGSESREMSVLLSRLEDQFLREDQCFQLERVLAQVDRENVHEHGNQCSNPLWWAVYHAEQQEWDSNAVQVIERFIAWGADPYYVYKDGLTVSQICAENSQLESVSRAIEKSFGTIAHLIVYDDPTGDMSDEELERFIDDQRKSWAEQSFPSLNEAEQKPTTAQRMMVQLALDLAKGGHILPLQKLLQPAIDVAVWGPF